ncbi:cysteine desulfurase family protein [Lentibacillus sp. CBA3610]|uniref:cysteine desulfurase family protein n=1 Tax=Lentibacillus sp. CBA3610 TaxID=2518176 RepID=UPI001595CDE7|nr:cysteine desulfurase family protein [Lentibacillus sp. CBA3610]QKY69693.1 cysteine desulfurase [Lentibacillus sp. CBA3610]
MIYLDNSATTKPNPAVLESFQQASERFFANPSSIHQLGGEAEKLLSKAREQAAQLLHVQRDEIVFTSGGTEGNNMAIKGTALEHQGRGKHIITTAIEHSSVDEAFKGLEQLGFDVTYVPVDENGVISVSELSDAIRDDTILISIMHVNNELGSVQPIREIGQIAKQYPKLFFHVDHVQGLGKVPLELAGSGIDLCTISGHKIHGLKGTGLLCVKQGTTLFPLFHGGNQEQALRSGTENLAGSVSLVKALRLTLERQSKGIPHMFQLQQVLRHKFSGMDTVKINTPDDAAPHIMNISVPGLKPEVMIHTLGEQKIYISTKSACSSKQSDESKILTECGHGTDRSTSALRISLAYDTTEEEIRTFLDALEQAIHQLKAVME